MPALSLKPGAAAVYRMGIDKTLTISQASRGMFKGMKDFRSKSNLVRSKKYSTGYHEAVVTTDHYYYLESATDNGDGTHTLVPSKSSVFSKYSGTIVDSEVLNHVLELGDTFRTDTAQTILSAPDGLAAGHSGSDISTVGQPAAHDLLRQKVMDIVVLPRSTKGLSKKSIATIFAAVTVTSMAPGELARTVTGTTLNLKGGALAKQNWEKNRNEAKSRVKTMYNTLNRDEKKFVMTHATEFMDSTKPKVPTLSIPSEREMDTSAPVSPRRDENYESGKSSEVAGLGYDGTAIGPPSLSPPVNENETGAYITQLFRADRIP
ncbi:hypothetical protein KRE47_01315 [Elizabethkingia meningoseptica]|uniref:hypothetical protein n=1 Tax=Elizabethkingia meningoseptica TaxID=238 RepID=UPI0022F194DA|nr:hypothetical protein [Elizabethkingia meningoseptica]EJK5327551.1 hypothetical protein [Elizabethkingia meningoseptica]MDE5467185.1 hypothetical protein [Elizabethkingia meningoseptica]MDE5473585.1 hypothetical protein [Elizabethkingia meningoseptica]MDE5477018.1 hypothetical protein [Elizabethkingia meningoseptica]MDE5484504.1 hypothetical protein [Elizabethkingia meningoseptica]